MHQVPRCIGFQSEVRDVSAASSFEYLKNTEARTNTPSELRAPVPRVPSEAQETLASHKIEQPHLFRLIALKK